MAETGFWNNQDAARETIAELKKDKGLLDPIEELCGQIEDVEVHYELAAEENNESELAEVNAEADKIRALLEKIELKTMLSGKHDSGNCYFSIHAGAGGTESCDWAEMLMRMYSRYFERNNFKAREIDRTDGEEAGIRSITIHVSGNWAFGYLSCERGVHRLVRISPFNAQGKRQTSFAAVDVCPELADVEIDINWDKDIREDTYRASGAGGQHVNTTDSAVRLTHIPSGIVVQCQNERSQHKNRAEARKMLASKVYLREQSKRDEELAKMYGDKGQIAFGNHIRSYVLYPYQLVRDERTGLKSSQTDDVLDGDLQEFIDAYLRERAARKHSPRE